MSELKLCDYRPCYIHFKNYYISPRYLLKYFPLNWVLKFCGEYNIVFFFQSEKKT